MKHPTPYTEELPEGWRYMMPEEVIPENAYFWNPTIKGWSPFDCSVGKVLKDWKHFEECRPVCCPLKKPVVVEET